jgi:hypothetical protein
MTARSYFVGLAQCPGPSEDIMVSFNPQALDFGAVPSHATGPDISFQASAGDGGVNLAGAVMCNNPTPAMVSASISGGDHYNFTVRSIASYKWRWQYVDPTELPAVPSGKKGPRPKVRVLELIDKSDTPTSPFSVTPDAQVVVVSVNYRAFIKRGLVKSTLLISGDTWGPNPIEIELSLTVEQVTAALGALSLTVVQGTSRAVPVT